MIKNFVFDISGVLADFQLKEYLAGKGFEDEIIKRIIKASVLSPFWGQFERAEITEEEAMNGFVSLDPDIEKELMTAYSNLEGMLKIRDYAIPLVKGLKKAGYGVYYLSNYSKKAYDECGESLAFMEYMDGGLVSFKTGLSKPDYRMYGLLLREYGLNAEECVFVDDTEENVTAARKLGYAGIVFKSYDDLIIRLRELKITNLRSGKS